MGFGRVLGFLVVLGGLGGALWWSKQTEPLPPAAARAVLDGRSLGEAERIQFRRADLAPIELERSADGGWRIAEPVRDRAAASVVQAMQQAFDRAQFVPGYVAAEIDERLLGECGLVPPQAELRAWYADGAEFVLELGLPGPLGHDLFARRTEAGAEPRIDRVDRSLLNALQVNVDEVRDRFVFATSPELASAVRIERPTGVGGARETVGVAREGGGRWRITAPKDLRADPARVFTLVSALLALRIEEFVPGDPSASAVGPESLFDAVVEIDGSLGSERLELRFLRETGRLVGHVTPRGIWFAAPIADFREWVEAPLRELRARWLVEVPVDELEAIRIAQPGGGEVEFTRDGLGQFRIARPIASNVDAVAMAELVQALRSLAAMEFVADAPGELARYGLTDGALRVELEAPRAKGAVRIGLDSGDELAFAQAEGEAQVVAIPRLVAQRLRRPWTDYVERRVLALESSGAIGAVRRELADGATLEIARGADGAFLRAGVPVDAGFEASLDVLRDLRAEAVLPRPALTDARPAGRLVVMAPSGQVHLDLELLGDAEGRSYVAIARLPGLVLRLSARDGRDLLALR